MSNDLTGGVPVSFTGGRSTIIEQVNYSSVQRKLYVALKTDRRYVYEQVPPSCYVAFFRATSRGRYYNKFIKGCYDCRQVMPTGELVKKLTLPTTRQADMAAVYDFFARKYDALRGRSRWDYELTKQDKWAANLDKHRAASNAKVISQLKE